MADLSKATPRPWAFRVRLDTPRMVRLIRRHWKIGHPGGKGVAIVFGDDDQNARLIVNAVNAHDDLVAGLRLIQVRASEACQSGTRDEISAAIGWIDDEARAALAKVGQPPVSSSWSATTPRKPLICGVNWRRGDCECLTRIGKPTKRR